MTKFIVFADIHIHNYNMFSNNEDRAETCISALNEIITYGESKNAYFLFPGDWFEKKAYINPSLFNKTCDILNKVTKPIYSVIGHHDGYTQDFVSYTMGSNKNIKLLNNNPIVINKIRIKGYHYWQEYNDKIDISDCDIALFHFNSLLPRNESEDKILKLYGHLHDPQDLPYNNYIIGSPIHHDFGDNPNLDRGFIEIDFNENSFQIKRIPLKSRKFITTTNPNDITNDYNYYKLLTNKITIYKKFINKKNVIAHYIDKRPENINTEHKSILLNPLDIIKAYDKDTVGVSIYNKYLLENRN